MARTKTASRQRTPTSLPTCPHCRAILGEHPGPSGLFDCKSCGAEIEPSSLAPVAVAPVEEAAKPPKSIARSLGPPPDHLTVTELQGAVRLEWNAPFSAADTFVGAMMLLFLAVVGVTLSYGASTHVWWPIAIVTVPVAGLAFGVRWQSKPKRVAVTMRRDLLIAVEEKLDPSRLSQAYVKEVEHRSTHENSDGETEERVWYTYDLRARLKDGDHRTLVEDVGSCDLALHLEQQLEKYYRITDARVIYEVPRD